MLPGRQVQLQALLVGGRSARHIPREHLDPVEPHAQGIVRPQGQARTTVGRGPHRTREVHGAEVRRQLEDLPIHEPRLQVPPRKRRCRLAPGEDARELVLLHRGLRSVGVSEAPRGVSAHRGEGLADHPRLPLQGLGQARVLAQPRPQLLLPRDLSRIQLCVRRPALLGELPLLRLQRLGARALFGTQVGQGGALAPAAPAPRVRGLVEEVKEAVVLLLGDRVVLVVVTAGALHREPHPHRRGRLHPVEHILDPRLLEDAPALAIGGVVAVERRRQDLLGRCVRQQVASQQLDRQLIEGAVLVEGPHEPVPPRPALARGVRLVAVRVRIARPLEPVPGHALPVLRRGEQPVHQVGIPAPEGAAERLVELLRRGRQPGQVQVETPDQLMRLGVLARRQLIGLERREDEGVDGRARPLGLPVGRRLNLSHRLEGPVPGPGCALLDPPHQHLDLSCAEAEA